MKIITNNKKRNLLHGFELPAKIYDKIRYDYMVKEDFDNSLFFIYQNEIYSLSEFQKSDNIPELKKWQGYITDTYFSGICIKIDIDDFPVIIGRFYN